MQIHELKIKYKFRKVKRVGRGGKRGTYSGRGQKGQTARAGRRVRPAERDVIQRLPKMRGIKFRRLSERPAVVNLDDLEKKIKGNIITLEVLAQSGLIRKRIKKAKILSNGSVKRPFEIKEGVLISEAARKKIEAAGGKING